MDSNLKEFFDKDLFAAYNGMKLIEVEPGYAVTQMEVTKNHLNAANVVQGGAIFTLADFAFAAASNSKGSITLGISANITYFRAPKGDILTAKATEVSSGRTICCYNVDIFDEGQTLIARFTATGFIKKDSITSYQTAKP